MANTYKLIASNVLASATGTVTFSSIPATYTDLVIKLSARSTNSGVTYNQLRIVFNSTSANLYSVTNISEYSNLVESFSGAASNTASEQTRGSIVGGANTANTFGTTEIYIPNYTSSSNKPFSSIGFAEDNSVNHASYHSIVDHAFLFADTSTISTIALSVVGTNFAIGSSFYLYGIKKD
jgi:hypothetical protein